MNVVLMRRLLGAGVLLLMLFIASLLLPAPTDPKPAEPGMRRIEVAVDDTRPIQMPKPISGAAPSTHSAADVRDESSSAKAVPDADSPVPPRAPVSPESAQAIASRFSQQTASEDSTRPEVTTAADEDDDVAAAPSADVAPPDEPEQKPVSAPKPKVVEVVPPPAKIETRPKPAVPVAPKPNTAATAEQKSRAAPAPVHPTAAAPATPAEKTPVRPPVVAAPTPTAKGARWAVQAGSYADIANARQIEAQLNALGFAASISLTESAGSARYRVRSGPFATRDAADAARARMQQNHIAASVVPDGG